MFSNPIKNVEQCGIQPGMEIADLGAGSGHYSMAIARALASTGKVYAIDINKDILTRLKNNAVKENLYNIEVVWGDVDNIKGTKLRDYAVDMVFACNIMFQIENKSDFIKEIKRILKPGGKAVIIDWADSFGGIGPKKEHVVSKEFTEKSFEKEGFHLERELFPGDHHYGLIYKKL
ncbi:MAG TPA: methyltransferase domain-containing protein [Parcubacteria group bacterium]|nr:methyltransferase domain-containing protein [Parcubacteria group bacterium]